MRVIERDINNACSNHSVFLRGKHIFNDESIFQMSIKRSDEDIIEASAVVEGSYDNEYDVYARLEVKNDIAAIRSYRCDCEAFNSYPGICKHIAAMLFNFNYNLENEIIDEFCIGQNYDIDVQTDDEMTRFDLNFDSVSFSSEQKKKISNYESLMEAADRINTYNRTVKSSSELTELMNYYIVRDRNNFCIENTNGDINIEVIFSVNIDELEYEFKIGRRQMYVVKDLFEFADNIRESRFVTYGRNLSFSHSQSSFSKDALFWIKILFESVTDTSNAAKSDIFSYTKQNRRRLAISPHVLDLIMERYEGREKLLFLNNGSNVRIEVVRDNPYFDVVIDRSGSGNRASVRMPRIHMFEGLNTTYMLWKNTMYVCEEQFCDELSGVLNLISGNSERNSLKMSRYYNSYYGASRNRVLGMSQGGDRYDLTLSEEDYVAFADTVLPIMRRYMDVHINNINFDKYEKLEPEFEVYLDADKQNDIICTPKVIYDDKTHNLIEPASLNETYRNIKSEYEVRSLLESYFNETDDSRKKYLIREDEERMLSFIEYGVEALNKYATVYASEQFKKIKISSKVVVTTGVSISGDLLEVNWNVEDMKPDELVAILADYKKKKKYHRLKNGDFLKIDDSGLSVLAELTDGMQLTKTQLKEGSVTVPMFRALYLDAVMRENADKIKTERNSEFKKIIREMKNSQDNDYEIPDNVTANLRPYQEIGYGWISTLAQFGFGGILADDMGLGKTLQIITFLASVKEQSKKTLVVCPASLVYNWLNEFDKFAPDMKVYAVLGNAAEREVLLNRAGDYEVVITSYDLLKRDISLYENMQFDYQIIDEAQYIKNPTTQVAKAVKGINSKCRFALTGTPIENRLSELWSIFEYLMPGYLFSYKHFRDDFEKNIVQSDDKKTLERLHRMIKPFILRRLKRDVLKELPDKLEEVVYARMGEEQERIYKANEKDIIMKLGNKTEEEFNSDKLEILAAITRLRQICCEPALLYDNFTGESAKLGTCIELVENAISGGHRILLFSQFTMMLDRLDRRLKELGIATLMLTGSTNKKQRNEMVNAFQRGEAEVFLISLKAGGTGLNLTAADIVIHYDPWWNVAAQNQATDRAHRIGQKNEVTVIKLIAKDTIEERILKLQEKKQNLADQVISEEGITLSRFSKDDLLDIFNT